ncbi:hypothetical protein MTR67_006738 [Solanum verrucosum]|uniref:Uncharacterized protein n=1 Tax=Solanum verrucosum TaxID=315347 RepID=A0AAF0PYW3_SOLVR|nr:hypothetical protein MTR67_006738 [Solanum verrucosum]
MFGWKFENSVIGDMVVEICSRIECSLEGGVIGSMEFWKGMEDKQLSHRPTDVGYGGNFKSVGSLNSQSLVHPVHGHWPIVESIPKATKHLMGHAW